MVQSMTAIQLPNFQGFEPTGEWRKARDGEHIIDVNGDLRVWRGEDGKDSELNYHIMRRSDWRSPSIFDCQSGPIPCRYRDFDDEPWKEGRLSSVNVEPDEDQIYFINNDMWHRYCEIKNDAT